MKILFLTLAVLLLGGCGPKRLTVNGMICPEGYSTPQQTVKDFTECKYYDEKKAAEASKSPISPACIQCLEDKGYKLEE